MAQNDQINHSELRTKLLERRKRNGLPNSTSEDDPPSKPPRTTSLLDEGVFKFKLQKGGMLPTQPRDKQGSTIPGNVGVDVYLPQENHAFWQDRKQKWLDWMKDPSPADTRIEVNDHFLYRGISRGYVIVPKRSAEKCLYEPISAPDALKWLDEQATRLVISAYGPAQKIPTGIEGCECPAGMWYMYILRSSYMDCLRMNPQVWDPNYTGPHEVTVWPGTQDVELKPGMRVVQLVPFIIPRFNGIQETTTLATTARGAGRYGSTN